MRALIVDDSKFIREYLKQILRPMMMLCEEAVDGKEAVALLERTEPFDLMFCDVNMPVMNGLDCVRTLRQSSRHAPMRVMMMTTDMDNALIEKALNYGADEFLIKPFTADGLREKLILLGIAGPQTRVFGEVQ